MKHALLISGEYTDNFGSFDNIANEDGSINWGVAMRADPGVKKCTGCGKFYWNEAAVMECTDCHARFGHGVTTPTKGG